MLMLCPGSRSMLTLCQWYGKEVGPCRMSNEKRIHVDVLSMEYVLVDGMSREILFMLTLCQLSMSMSTLCQSRFCPC